MQETGMIDVNEKPKTIRVAKAHSFVKMDVELVKMVRDNKAQKGNVIEIARVAGVMAGKKTSNLLPYCHNIDIGKISLDFELVANGIHIISFAKTTDKTGIEMEALTACSVAALTIYDMLKMYSQEIEICNTYLLEKSGGKSGFYKRKS